LLLQLQTRMLNRTLRANGDRQFVELRRMWTTLQDWFPPPTRSRVLTPLIPAYDSRRDVIGFYRVVVPRMLRWGPPLDALPEQPTGAGMLEFLLAADDELAAQLRITTQVTTIAVTPLRRAEAREGAPRIFEPWPTPQPPHSAFLTRVDLLAGSETISLTGLHVRTSLTGSEFELRCLQVNKGSSRKAPLSWKIKSVIGSAGRSCSRRVLDGFEPAR
jgi:hypothetical protein